MTHGTFKLHMAAAQQRLLAPVNSNNESRIHVTRDGVLEADKLYTAHIHALIISLNQCNSDSGRNTLITQINETNRIYLEACQLRFNAQILFSRHGKSTMLREKILGLKPNAPISVSAQKNMQGVNQHTQGFLAFKNLPRIVISPMVRALQTAALLMPTSIRGADVVVNPVLAETSISPSGMDVRSLEDLRKLNEQISFWRAPWQAILFFFSRMFYGDAHFQDSQQLRQKAMDEIQAYNGGATIIQSNGDVDQDLLLGQDMKLLHTQQLIHEVEDQDLWLIGHGNNFRRFFKKTFALQVSFDYAETRAIFKVTENSGEVKFFIPPYTLIVNQNTGKIEGKYTGTAQLVCAHQEKAVELESIEEVMPSFQLMHTQGLGRRAPAFIVPNEPRRVGSLFVSQRALNSKTGEERREVPSPN